MKKYFLKEESLYKADEDYFRYRDFANNLQRIIEHNEPPFNVAVIGKWGIGKSSMINLAIENLKLRPDKFLIIQLNAWKYEKDDIEKAFIMELWEKISNKKAFSFMLFHMEHDEMVKSQMNNNKIQIESWRGWFKFIFVFFLILISSLLMFAIYCIVSNWYYGVSFNTYYYMASIFLRYCKNIGNILIVPMAVWLGKIFIDRLNTQPYRKYEMTFPMNTNADYKLYLDNLLHNYHQENPDSKIIVVIDDLDRLSSDKIVEALDALKMFMEYDRFVFIVPFDDSVLRQMIIKERYREICLSMDEFEADLILDKLFQYKIYMPLIPRSDISNYAIKLSNSLCGSFIKDYFKSDKDAFDEIIGLILIHNAVKTPRQVKKIINTFIENVMVARDRELAGQVEVGFATGRAGIETIAKLSVLQADFADFYNLLFYNASAMEEILEVHRGDGLVEPSKSLQRYFDDNNMLRRKYESLVNFLIVTEKCGRANIKSYLYIL